VLLRLRVRLRNRGLDTRLAEGTIPALDPELELRASQLEDPALRATIARALRRAMRTADRRRRGGWIGSRVPVATASIRACMPELRDLARALTDIRAGAQGVAIASLLVTDGSSPLYVNVGAQRLRDAVLAAYFAL
jgi:hypothetical protein